MQKYKIPIFFTIVLVWTSIMIVIEGHMLILGIVSIFSSLILLLSLLFSVKRSKSESMNKEDVIENEFVIKADNTISNEVVFRIPVSEFLNIDHYGREVFKALSQQMELSIGLLYKIDGDSSKIVSHFAVPEDFENIGASKENQGFIEQVITGQQLLEITEIPSDFPFAFSGLGMSCPTTIIFIPIIKGDTCIYVFELGFLNKLTKDTSQIITETIAKLNIPNYEE